MCVGCIFHLYEYRFQYGAALEEVIVFSSSVLKSKNIEGDAKV
jgi:hypothetical protein